MPWTDPLSPRIKALIERHKSSGDNERRRHGAERQFQVRHFPDRPPPRPRREDIPAEAECERLIRGWANGSGHEAVASPKGSDRRAGPRIQTQEDLDVGLGISGSSRERWREANRSSNESNNSPRGIPEDAIYKTKYLQEREVKDSSRKRFPMSTSSSIYSSDHELDSPSRPKDSSPHPTLPPRSIYGYSPIYASPEPIYASPEPNRHHKCPLCNTPIPPSNQLCKSCKKEFSMTASDFLTPRTPDIRPIPPLPRDADHVAHHYHSERFSSTSTNTDTSSVFHTPPTSRNSETATFAQSPLRTQTSLSAGSVHSRFQLQRPCVADIVSGDGDFEVEVEAEVKGDDLYDGEWAEYYFDDDNFRESGNGAERVSDKSLRRKLRVTEGDAASVGAVLQAQSWVNWI